MSIWQPVDGDITCSVASISGYGRDHGAASSLHGCETLQYRTHRMSADEGFVYFEVLRCSDDAYEVRPFNV